MQRTWVVVALVVVASTVGAGAQADGIDCPVDVAESDEPGQELANVVGAQESVVARELERRGFNATLANASTPRERATVVATELERIEARVANLEDCQAALVTAHEEDDLTVGEYRERAASLEPDVVDVRERLDRAAEATDELGQRVRERNDIDEERFEGLETRVSDLDSYVDRPERAIEPADGASDDDTPEPTPTESPEPTTETETETETEEPDQTPEPTTTTESPDDANGQDEEDEETEATPTPGDDGRSGANYG